MRATQAGCGSLSRGRTRTPSRRTGQAPKVARGHRDLEFELRGSTLACNVQYPHGSSLKRQTDRRAGWRRPGPGAICSSGCQCQPECVELRISGLIRNLQHLRYPRTHWQGVGLYVLRDQIRVPGAISNSRAVQRKQGSELHNFHGNRWLSVLSNISQLGSSVCAPNSMVGEFGWLAAEQGLRFNVQTQN